MVGGLRTLPHAVDVQRARSHAMACQSLTVRGLLPEHLKPLVGPLQ